MIMAAARRFAMTAPRAMPAAPRAMPAFRPVFTRGAAQVVTSPMPLSFRMDGLMMQCVVAALIYFVPQDLVFLTGLFRMWHVEAASVSPCQKQSDAEAAVEEWKAKKGLDKVAVAKGSRTWQVCIE
mmetsp:Transcript_22633/g.57716  ORF Transcript_22633/g.57716 Transcript_22633/m.57716 type:complete len:126 (-) Transcript_22633:114-491(-)